MDTLTI
jgi:hypothetical protein